MLEPWPKSIELPVENGDIYIDWVGEPELLKGKGGERVKTELASQMRLTS